MPGKTRDCTLVKNIMFKLVGFEFYEAMHKELSLLLTPAISKATLGLIEIELKDPPVSLASKGINCVLPFDFTFSFMCIEVVNNSF